MDKKENGMKQWSKIIKNVTMLSQFSLSLITPLLLCLAFCWFLISHTGVGGWIFIPGFFFGLGGSGTFIVDGREIYMSIMDNVQPVVKKETGRVSAITGIGLLIMWIVFGVLHAFMPQKVPFDYTVFLGGAAGGCVAVLNFFLMGLAVQKAAAATDEDTARMRIKASYSQRMMIQMLWVIIAIVAPCFHFVAGIVPLLFPGTGIKIAGIFHTKK